MKLWLQRLDLTDASRTGHGSVFRGISNFMASAADSQTASQHGDDGNRDANIERRQAGDGNRFLQQGSANSSTPQSLIPPLGASMRFPAARPGQCRMEFCPFWMYGELEPSADRFAQFLARISGGIPPLDGTLQLSSWPSTQGHRCLLSSFRIRLKTGLGNSIRTKSAPR